MSRLLPKGFAGILALVIAAAPFVVGSYNLDVLATGVIYGMMAMGLAVLIGQAGLPSLGHAAFVGVGGYAAAILAKDVTTEPLIAIVLAGIVGAILSVLLGLMSLRSQGIYFLMISLALAELVHAAVIRSDFVGGDNGLSISHPEVPVFGAIGVPRDVAMYWFIVAFAIFVFAILKTYMISPVGQATVASKDNAERMRALGYSVRALRMTALIISGVVVAIGGALLTQKDVFISPSTLQPDTSILLLVMVLVGGGSTLLGPFLAGVMLVFLRSWISSNFGEYWILVLGAVFVLTVYFLPSGISGMARRVSTSENSEQETDHVYE